ncbi:MAG: radical SAM protein [Deltaproteobacteria bacterium]|nr:radical SAM protein [Deltaproteobacteria bacterium]
MDILINPFYPISETPSPPLGLAFLAAALERAGVEVQVLDLVVFPYTKGLLERVLTRFQPDMVGATSVTMTFDHGISVLNDVKDIDPAIVTVMGGPHVTFRAEKTLREYPALDVVALGEGDRTIVDLARAAQNGKTWGEVKGVVYRDGDDIRRTPPRDRLEDMNSLPVPARHLLPLGRYRSLSMPISMTTSRGCPFQCIFCVGRKMVGAKVRYRDPNAVVDELEELIRFGFHQINIADDLFTANPRHCIAVCDGILERGLDVKWAAFARVDTVTREVLTKMKEGGCQTVSFGVESANREILRRIRKGITTDQVIRAVQMCADAGIQAHVSFILGLPGETPETMDETARFGETIKSMGAIYGYHLLAPFPGTEVREKSAELGINILTDDWRDYHANRAIVETDHVSRAMLDAVAIEWEQEFDQWLEYIKVLRERGQAAEDDAWQLTRLEHTVLIYDLMMEEMLEKWGSWKNGSDPMSRDADLETLAERLASATNQTRDQVVSTLNYASDRDFLEYESNRGRVKWRWVDYL